MTSPSEPTFTIEELRALYKLLEYEYIPYENREGHAVVNKIMRLIKKYESTGAKLD